MVKVTVVQLLVYRKQHPEGRGFDSSLFISCVNSIHSYLCKHEVSVLKLVFSDNLLLSRVVGGILEFSVVSRKYYDFKTKPLKKRKRKKHRPVAASPELGDAASNKEEEAGDQDDLNRPGSKKIIIEDFVEIKPMGALAKVRLAKSRGITSRKVVHRRICSKCGGVNTCLCLILC